MNDWKIFQGDGEITLAGDDGELARKADLIADLPSPPWRDFASIDSHRADTYQPPPDAVEVVNAALYLRRPILVTGKPGTGKTSLIYAVAKELEFGGVLAWPINSRSTLTDGLYRYDAVARLRQARIDREGGSDGGRGQGQGDGANKGGQTAARDEQIGRFIKLGPLGTAFLAGERPRALLIDEIDKSDVDLPNDLLHIFEDGTFEIPELVRIAGEQPRVEVEVTTPNRPKGEQGGPDVTQTASEKAWIDKGRVRCKSFPFVVITSNGERDLPPAFLRRCLRLDLDYPKTQRLAEIVEAHLGEGAAADLDALIQEFRDRQKKGTNLATDQLLNTVFMIANGAGAGEAARKKLEQILLRELEAR